MNLKLKSVPAGVTRMSARDFRNLPEKQKKNKFGAKPKTVDGIRFDSTLEADRWASLELMQRAGMIKNLKRQVAYPLEVNGELMTTYYADYVYEEGGKTVVEDAKGKRTRMYTLKKKLMLTIHGIRIREFTKSGKNRRAGAKSK